MKLLKTVDEYIPIPPRDLEKPLMFPIERGYGIKGRGTVVTGKVERGTVKKGDELEAVGRGATWKTTVTGKGVFVPFLDQDSVFAFLGVEMFHKIVEKAEAGDQLGLLLRGVERDQAKRGIVLIPKGSNVQAQDRFEAKVSKSPFLFVWLLLH